MTVEYSILERTHTIDIQEAYRSRHLVSISEFLI